MMILLSKVLFCVFAASFANCNGEEQAQIINRQLKASLVANDWTTDASSPYCEAFGFIDAQPTIPGLFDEQSLLKKSEWKKMYFESLTSKTLQQDQSEVDYKSSVEGAIAAAFNEESNNDVELLKYALSIRAHAPLCEMHNSLATSALKITEKGTQPDAFAIVAGDNSSLTYTRADESGNFESFVIPTEAFSEIPVWAKALPEEDILVTEESKDKPAAIIYGSFHSKHFANLYRTLREKHSLVVRHMHMVASANDDNGKHITTLQGYGVRLDVKNVEYKSFDDKDLNNDDLANTDNNEEVDDICSGLRVDEVKERFTNGVDPTWTKAGSPVMENFFDQYLPNLKGKDGIPDLANIIIPSKSQIQDLSLQATKVISESKDPLWTLQVLTQNLPTFASSLQNVTIPSSFRSEATKIDNLFSDGMMGFGGFGERESTMDFYVNGRDIHVERPSFNLFELLKIVREEKELLQTIKALNLEPRIEKLVAEFVGMGKENFDEAAKKDSKEEISDDEFFGGMPNIDEPKVRVDVGTGYKGAVIYLNDIERDQEFQQWPRQIEQALMRMQFGGQFTIRRNVITVVVVLDPLSSEDDHQVIGMMMQMMQHGMPIRVGVIFASESDIETCKNNATSDGKCHVASSGTEMVTTATLMRLHLFVTKKYGKSLAFPYIYLLSEAVHSGMTLAELVPLHYSILSEMGVGDDGSASALLDILSNPTATVSNSMSYEKAVNFAVSKNIKPGQVFVNGIPTLVGECESVIMEETQRIVGMIMSGKITDNKPKSIYAMLLKGDGVRSSMHPLLSEKDATYVSLNSDSIVENIIIPPRNNDKLDTKLVLSFIGDFEKSTCSQKLVEFLRSVISFSENETNKVSIGIRVIPSNLESSNSDVARIFRYGSRFELPELLALAQHFSERNTMLTKTLDLSTSMLSKLPDIDTEPLYEDQVLDKGGSTEYGIVLNGRVFIPEDIVTPQDIEMLVDLEENTASFIAEKISNIDNTLSSFATISRISSFLRSLFESKWYSSTSRKDASMMLADVGNSSLLFSWNDAELDMEEELSVEIIAVLDPLTDAAQRAAPLLLGFRDTLKLPVKVLFAPRKDITEGSSIPLNSYYRFVAESMSNTEMIPTPNAHFQGLPLNQILTLKMDTPEPFDVQQSSVVQDTDNLRCDKRICGDRAFVDKSGTQKRLDEHLTEVEYNLNSLLFAGQCYDAINRSPPNGLQITLSDASNSVLVQNGEASVGSDGSVSNTFGSPNTPYSGSLVMKTVGYIQLRSKPNVWRLEIAQGTRGAEIYDLIEGGQNKGQVESVDYKLIMMKDFVNQMEAILVKRKDGYEDAELLSFEDTKEIKKDDTVHVFSLATGHLYERFLKIMMLSVVKRTSGKVKFWLLENFLSPSFKSSAFALAEEIGCEVEFITYKWPEWLRNQTEKQRIIWGYKILFLDVLFPLDLKKIIYVDADQVVRGDLRELWEMDLEGAPYGYTPMCESREETKGYQFWREGFWTSHLRGKPYHISALYVVDLQRFRRELVGDQLRSMYQQLTADPNNLSNLDQDLPNYTQHQIKIFSLPQEWLWCESWCSEETKKTAKTIDLCNNPQHKEPKVSMAKRIISGELFNESWIELDEEVAKLESHQTRDG